LHSNTQQGIRFSGARSAHETGKNYTYPQSANSRSASTPGSIFDRRGHPTHPTALIAEDEPLLAQALRAELAAAWPGLHVTATVGDGHSAVREALAHLPQVLFLDIRMPGLDGLGVAAELADAWPVDEAPLPQLVFVTAYDEYAARAFDAQAIDYVLKPVRPERLRRTVERLRAALAPHSPPADALAGTLAQWHRALAAAESAAAAVAPLTGLNAEQNCPPMT
jgi:DNA-binding LytR/AlgR family response regulator